MIRDYQVQIEELKGFMEIGGTYEENCMKLTQKTQELDKEIMKLSEENSLIMSRLVDYKAEKEKIKKICEQKDKDISKLLENEEKYKAQIMDLKMQLNRAKEAEIEHTK